MSPNANTSASRVEIKLPNPNSVGTMISGAINENVPPSTIAWTGVEWSEPRIITVNPKSARQARGGSSLFIRMFAF